MFGQTLTIYIYNCSLQKYTEIFGVAIGIVLVYIFFVFILYILLQWNRFYPAWFQHMLFYKDISCLSKGPYYPIYSKI